MRPTALALAVGVALGALASCVQFRTALEDYCAKTSDGGCTCNAGQECCVNDGFVANTPQECCAGLKPKPLEGDSGVQCCSDAGCLGPSDGGTQCTGGDSGVLGAPCGSWTDCACPLACAADLDGGFGASCSPNVCWYDQAGRTSFCGSQIYGTGVVTLSGTGDAICALPGQLGTVACCYERGAGGQPVGCMVGSSKCTCNPDGGGCVRDSPTRQCPP